LKELSSSYSTYCRDLWDGFAIMKNGNIFCCCHLGPSRVGNIHQSLLSEIVNSEALVLHRQESLDGRLGCYDTCNLVDKGLRPGPRIETRIRYNDCRRLHISFGESCNIRCIRCEHPGRHRKDGILLDSEVLVKNVDISPFEEIILQGGEPLTIPSCLRFMNYLEEVKKKYTLLTNGLLIDARMADRLARYAKAVSISINGASKKTHEIVNLGSCFETVTRNIGLLREARMRRGSGLIVHGRMTLVPQNVHEIPSFIESYSDMGFDRIDFGYDRSTVPQFLAENPLLTESLRKGIADALVNSDSERMNLRRLEQLGLLKI